MDQKQAERFLEAAQADYEFAWVAYTALMARRLEDDVASDDVRELRADVLAAQQVLEVARTQVEGILRKGQDSGRSCISEGGICDGCAGLATVLVLYGERYLCPTCGIRAEEERPRRA